MNDNSASSALERKSSFLLAIAERAKHLAEEVEALADAVKGVEDAREELADILADEDATEAEKEEARGWLAKKEERLAVRRERADILEAHLSNFKDDASMLVTDNLVQLTR